VRLAPIPMALFALIPAFADTHTLDSVGVTAVLLTRPSVRRLFGAEIANTYAVVQLNISNNNADAAFVLHSAEMRGN
jgi:hypothetical protein